MDWGFIGFSFYLFNNRCDGVLTSHWYNITTVQYIQPINWKQCALLYWHEKLITSFQKCFKIGPGVELKEFCIVYIHFLNVFLPPPPPSPIRSLFLAHFSTLFFFSLYLSRSFLSDSVSFAFPLTCNLIHLPKILLLTLHPRHPWLSSVITRSNVSLHSCN